MELRALGQTGIRVSRLGLGAVKFGRNARLRNPAAFALPTDAELRHLLAEAHALGINLIDTAPAYGSSEARIGALLPGQRDAWVLATKVGEQFDEHGSQFDFSGASVRASIERSLTRLRTDYLDIVSVHSNGNDIQILEHSDCIETLRLLQQEGHIRSVAFSCKTLAGGLAALRYCDTVMVSLAPQDRAETTVVAAAQREQRGVLVKKALDSGFLAGPALTEHFRWLRMLPGISSVVVGTINPKHLRDNAALLG